MTPWPQSFERVGELAVAPFFTSKKSQAQLFELYSTCVFQFIGIYAFYQKYILLYLHQSHQKQGQSVFQGET